MPFRLGPWEIGLILVIVLVVFGVGKLPKIGGAVGRSIREFRNATHGDDKTEAPHESAGKAAASTVIEGNRG
jgi:sec-independent protein translocase protein TatA